MLLQSRLKNSFAIFVKVSIIQHAHTLQGQLSCPPPLTSQILALASCEESDAAVLLHCIVQASSKFHEPSDVADPSSDTAPAPALASASDLSNLLGNSSPAAAPRRNGRTHRH